MKRVRPFLVLLATMLVATMAVAGPQARQAAAEVDVYITDGTHVVNGRTWYTECEPYSTAVTRCWTDIDATTVKYEDGKYTEVFGRVFNNLTYHGAPRSNWAGNPLARTGSWTAEDGRLWRTECDTAVTGANGCRSYVTATKPVVVSVTPRVLGTRTLEVFNNLIRFSAEPAPAPKPTWPCNSATLPSGFAMTPAGLPHSTKPPYTPIDLYNPTSVSNFVRVVYAKIQNMRANKPTDPSAVPAWERAVDDQVCLAFTAGNKLIEGSDTQRYNGTTVRWYPYLFDFRANPSNEFDVLPGNPGWYSGLAQGGVLGALSQLHLLAKSEDPAGVGDPKWTQYGRETFESFMVPLADGGITSRENGFLWFEEYPTTPEPTTVLNGHMEALIGLDIWYRNSGEPRAKELFDEAVGDLEPLLALSEVEVDGGLATSYDLVRGYEAGALRFRPQPSATISSATFNGATVTLPVGAGGVRGTNQLNHSDMNNIDLSGKATDRWAVLNAGSGGSTDIRYYGRTSPELRGISVKTSKSGWRGVQQSVDNFAPGQPLTLSFDSKLSFDRDAERGVAGKVAVYATCGNTTTLLYESQRTRSKVWDSYNHSFTAPRDPACRILVQLVSSSWGTDNTYVWYDDVQLTTAEAKGAPGTGFFQPEFHRPDNLMVFRTPVTEIGLRGSGSGYLQVYADGVWEDISGLITLGRTEQKVEVPQRYTGRNIHLAYHENHIDELISLCWRSKEQFFNHYAKRWQPMAPAHNHTVVPNCDPSILTTQRQQQQVPDLRNYDYEPNVIYLDVTQEQ